MQFIIPYKLFRNGHFSPKCAFFNERSSLYTLERLKQTLKIKS